MTPGAERVPHPSSKADAAAAAKAKSDERKAHLEAFRAKKAAAKAAAEPPAAAPAAAPRPAKPRPMEAAKSQQRDPNVPPAAKTKAASLSPERKPSRPSSAAAAGKPRAPSARPRLGARAPAAVRSKPEPALEPAKASPFVEAQHAFGCETTRPVESRRASQVGEPAAPTSLGPGLTDDGDPTHGLRWHLQLERFRLQQWQLLNARVEAARQAQQGQADAQLAIAAGAVASLQQQVAAERVRQARQRGLERAGAALAAQAPRLELYDSLKEGHQGSMERITTAITASLQQMPLTGGALCGTPAAADAEQLRQALQQLEGVLAQIEPRAQPLTAPPAAQGGGSGGVAAIAAAAVALAADDQQLRQHLQANAGLVAGLERSLLHSESLAIQLLQMQGGK